MCPTNLSLFKKRQPQTKKFWSWIGWFNEQYGLPSSTDYIMNNSICIVSGGFLSPWKVTVTLLINMPTLVLKPIKHAKVIDYLFWFLDSKLNVLNLPWYDKNDSIILGKWQYHTFSVHICWLYFPAFSIARMSSLWYSFLKDKHMLSIFNS